MDVLEHNIWRGVCIVEVEGRVQAEVVFLPSKVVEGCNLMEGFVCIWITVLPFSIH